MSNILDGTWFDVVNETSHNCLKAYGRLTPVGMRARVQKGQYIGPGRYLVLSYTQRCPRNCCDDTVHSVLTSEQVIDQCKEQMKQLAEMLKCAKEKL